MYIIKTDHAPPHIHLKKNNAVYDWLCLPNSLEILMWEA